MLRPEVGEASDASLLDASLPRSDGASSSGIRRHTCDGDTAVQALVLAGFAGAVFLALVTANDCLAKILGGCVSLCALCYLFGCYFARGWRRYPNRLLVWRGAANTVCAVAVLSTAIADYLETSGGARTTDCNSWSVVLNPLLLQATAAALPSSPLRLPPAPDPAFSNAVSATTV